MRYKVIFGILVLCVSALMLMPGVLAATGPPYVWAAQATLSTPDAFASQDPENSGYGMLQVSVWEEWNGADWDIYMKYSLADGAPGTWVFSPVNPAITAFNEQNPAVAVTRNHPVTGQEIHVVYERWNPGPPGFWEICHTYTNNLGVAWVGPTVISTAGFSSTNPACVQTEDQSNPGGFNGFLIQVVWEQAMAPPLGGTGIMYRAFAYDPTWVPVRGYVPGIAVAPFLIRAPPVAGLTCELPEIASVDERISPAAYDYTFNIVWQETNAVGNWNVWYVAGTTTTSPNPPPPTVVLTVGSLGTLNVVVAGSDHTDPDIAASQDYMPVGAISQGYYFHILWVRQTPALPNFIFAVDSCYWYGANPTPASAVFIATPAVAITPPVAFPPVAFDNPTIATKLITPPIIVPTIFETWFAWEDSIAGLNMDIWFNVGQYTTGPPPVFAFMPGALARVLYIPNPDISNEQNPELWNREDALRVNPPVTHLVFDRNPDPIGGGIEVEYIDP